MSYREYMGVIETPCPTASADKPLLHTLQAQGLLQTPCNALSRGYERLRALMVLEGLSRQARPVTYPL